MTQTSFYSPEELSGLGLKSYGTSVQITQFARIYSSQCISIGNNVRIDDFVYYQGIYLLVQTSTFSLL